MLDTMLSTVKTAYGDRRRARCDDEGRLETVLTSGPAAVMTPLSGTVAAGSVAQTLSAANAGRRGYRLRNVSAGPLWISATGTAAANNGSFEIKAGEYYETPMGGCPTTALSLIGVSAGQAFFGEEW